MLTLALPLFPLMLTGWSYPCPPLKPPLSHQSTTGSISDAQWQIISGKEMGGPREAVLVSGGWKEHTSSSAALSPRLIHVFHLFSPKSPGALADLSWFCE